MQGEIGNPEKVNSVDSLYEAHIRYLNKALFRCILNKKARPVHKIIIDIFNIVAKFSIVLTSRRVGTLSALLRNQLHGNHGGLTLIFFIHFMEIMPICPF